MTTSLPSRYPNRRKDRRQDIRHHLTEWHLVPDNLLKDLSSLRMYEMHHRMHTHQHDELQPLPDSEGDGRPA